MGVLEHHVLVERDPTQLHQSLDHCVLETAESLRTQTHDHGVQDLEHVLGVQVELQDLEHLAFQVPVLRVAVVHHRTRLQVIPDLLAQLYNSRVGYFLHLAGQVQTDERDLLRIRGVETLLQVESTVVGESGALYSQG